MRLFEITSTNETWYRGQVHPYINDIPVLRSGSEDKHGIGVYLTTGIGHARDFALPSGEHNRQGIIYQVDVHVSNIFNAYNNISDKDFEYLANEAEVPIIDNSITIKSNIGNNSATIYRGELIKSVHKKLVVVIKNFNKELATMGYDAYYLMGRNSSERVMVVFDPNNVSIIDKKIVERQA